MDGEGPLARLGRAALVDVVGDQQVECLDQAGEAEAAPVLELVTPEMEPLLWRPWATPADTVNSHGELLSASPSIIIIIEYN